jgi:hypothetical protein
LSVAAAKKFYPELGNAGLWVTEMTTRSAIDTAVGFCRSEAEEPRGEQAAEEVVR